MYATYSTSEHIHELCEWQKSAYAVGVFPWDDPWVEALGKLADEQLDVQLTALNLGYPISLYSQLLFRPEK